MCEFSLQICANQPANLCTLLHPHLGLAQLTHEIAYNHATSRDYASKHDSVTWHIFYSCTYSESELQCIVRGNLGKNALPFDKNALPFDKNALMHYLLTRMHYTVPIIAAKVFSHSRYPMCIITSPFHRTQRRIRRVKSATPNSQSPMVSPGPGTPRRSLSITPKQPTLSSSDLSILSTLSGSVSPSDGRKSPYRRSK